MSPKGWRKIVKLLNRTKPPLLLPIGLKTACLLRSKIFLQAYWFIWCAENSVEVKASKSKRVRQSLYTISRYFKVWYTIA